MPKQFIITGMPHSGTSYAKAVLLKLGLNIVHHNPNVFPPQGIGNKDPNKQLGTYDGMSGSAAAPYIGALDRNKVVIAHQVRNPYNVVRGMLSRGYFTKNERAATRMYSVGVKFMLNTFAFFFDGYYKKDEISLAGSVNYCCKLYTLWNDLIAGYKPDITFQVENPKYDELLDLAGLEYNSDVLRQLLQQVSKTIRTRPHRYENVANSMFPDYFKDYAKKLGYDD